jgi:hypothetical protein
MQDKLGIYGEVTAILYDAKGNVRNIQSSSNLLLDRGINYIYQQIFSRLENFSVVSPQLSYKPTFNPFEYMAVGFSDQYYTDPYADPYGFPFDPYIGESNNEFNYNVQAVYAKKHLDTEKVTTEVRTITLYDSFSEYIAIGKRSHDFLFMASKYDGSTYERNSALYLHDGSEYIKYQDIATIGATDCVFFEIDSEYYLGVTFERNDAASYSQNSIIYKWDGDIFQQHQAISTTGAYSIEYFTFRDFHYIAISSYYDGSSYAKNLVIYRWNGSTFESFQTITGGNYFHSKFFTIDNDYYLFVANRYNGSTYSLISTLYKWDSDASLFISFQTFTTYGAGKADYIQIGNDHYLAIPHYNNGSSYSIDSKVYKWNGTQFVSFQSISTNGAIKAYFFVYETNVYLTFVNYYNGTQYVLDSPIYIWDGTEFEYLQNISTVGSQDVKFFEAMDTYYLLYPHNYNGSIYSDLRSGLYSRYVGAEFVIADHVVASGCLNSTAYKVVEQNPIISFIADGEEHTWRIENIDNADRIDFNFNNSGKLVFELGDISSDITDGVFTVPFVYMYASADDDFVVETRVAITNGSGMAGVCIKDEYASNSHNVFVASRDWLDPYTDTSVVSGNSETSVYDNPTYITELTQTNTDFRIVKTGSVISTYSKNFDEDSWILIGTYNRSDIEGYIQIGMFAGSTDGNNCTAEFYYFNFNHKDRIDIDIICDYAYDDFNTTSPVIVNTVGFAADTNTKVDEENVFLLHADDTPITDASGLNGDAVIYGGAGINLSTKYFGDGALNLPSSGSYISFPYASPYEDATDSFNFDNDDFTVELFLYLNSDGTDKSFIGNRTTDTGDYGWLICIHDVTNVVEWHTNNSVIIDSPSNTALNNSTWYHLAFVRYKGILYYYLGGSLILSASDTNYYRTNTDLLIGRDGSSVRGDANGVVIDEIRISKGARWTSNFSIPTQAYNRTQQDNATTHLWGTRVNITPVVINQGETLRIVYRMGVNR